MNQSATKSIPKKKNFNKKDVAKKLDKLASKVSQKAIYVIGRDSDGYYTIVNYKNNQTVYKDIPRKDIAERMCNSCNRRPYTNTKVKDIYKLFDTYHRMYSDIQFYRHTIKNTSSNDLYWSTTFRLEITVERLKNLVRAIISTC